MNLENQKYQLCIARQKGYKFSKNFVIPPAVYAAGTMFWDSLGANDEPEPYSNLDDLPNWTEDMRAAWELVDEIRASGLDGHIQSPSENKSAEWGVCFQGKNLVIQETGPTTPLAICKAWLKWQKTYNLVSVPKWRKGGECSNL